MSVSLYLNYQTWVHELDGRTKVLAALGFFGLAMCFSHPVYLFGVLAIVVGALAVAHAGLNVKKIWVLTTLLVCYSVILWPFFVQGATPIPIFGELGITWEGCTFGLGMGLRLLIMVWVGVWLLSTTAIEELAEACQQLGLPSPMSFAFSLAFRWAGILLGTGLGVVQAQQARGLDLSSGGIGQRIRKYVPLAVPLIGHALRQTNLLAMALESKGFHPTAKRTLCTRAKMQAMDYVVISTLSVLLSLSIWMRWYGVGTLNVSF